MENEIIMFQEIYILFFLGLAQAMIFLTILKCKKTRNIIFFKNYSCNKTPGITDDMLDSKRYSILLYMIVLIYCHIEFPIQHKYKKNIPVIT